MARIKHGKWMVSRVGDAPHSGIGKSIHLGPHGNLYPIPPRQRQTQLVSIS